MGIWREFYLIFFLINIHRQILILFCFPLFLNAQISEQFALNQFKKYSPSTYFAMKSFKENGSSVSFNGNSISSSMKSFEYCDFSSTKSFLQSISTTVHESIHAFDGQLPILQAKKGYYTLKGNNEGFYIDENTLFIYDYPKNKLFASRKLARSIPANLRTFRYKTYIESESNNQSTQSSGVVGLLEEFNAYYHGAKVIFDLLPLFKETYGDHFLFDWSTKFYSNADAFYEFDFFVKEYLLYAKQYEPMLYNELKNDINFKNIYRTIRTKFYSMIKEYEKKYDEFNLQASKSNVYYFSSEKHSNLIYPILSEVIESEKYETIKRDFLE